MLCPSLEQYQFRNKFIHYVCLGPNKCQEILKKILASPAKSLFSLQCLADYRRWKSLLTWLPKLLVWVQKAYIPFPKGVGLVMLVPQHPDLGSLGSWEETLQREPKPVSLSCPTQVSQAHTIFPGSLLPVILGAAASFWDVSLLSLSLLGSSSSLFYEQVRTGGDVIAPSTCIGARGREMVS